MSYSWDQKTVDWCYELVDIDCVMAKYIPLAMYLMVGLWYCNYVLFFMYLQQLVAIAVEQSPEQCFFK